MNLTPHQQERVAHFIPAFHQYLESGGRDADLADRQARSQLYGQLLSPDGLEQMTELEFGKVISSLWASQLWTNKGYLVDKLVSDNGLPALVSALRQLLWGQEPIGDRYDGFRDSIKDLGSASITEILALVHPDECGIWNDKARKALEALGVEATFPTVGKYQISGREYEEFNELLCSLRDELEENGIHGLDILGVDYFLFEVWRTGKREGEPLRPTPDTEPGYDFDHDQVVDELVAIGQWLGFEAEKEKRIATGARVDVTWQARIANLGAVTYVFEVQRRGAIDSLILNLQRAQNNPSVQRLVVVANSDDIARVVREIASLPESFRRSVAFMEAADTMRAAELLDELSGIINKLELVRSEFAT